MQGAVICDKKSFSIRGVFNEFQSFIKPQGKPVLVPKADDRKDLNTAANDFEEENTYE